MKSNKPKGKTPSLIGGTLGAPRQCTVLKASACNRCKGPLVKGAKCHEIPQLGSAFTNYKKYCDKCFIDILTKTKADLDVLFAVFEDEV